MPVDIEKANFDEPREQDGFRAQRARISRQAGAERLGVSLWESPPGQAPEVVPQLDSGKIGGFERRPDGGGLRVWSRTENEVEYYEGESAPG
jgi:hypothetical protein